MYKEGGLNSEFLLVVAKINICVKSVIIQLPQHAVHTSEDCLIGELLLRLS